MWRQRQRDHRPGRPPAADRRARGGDRRSRTGRSRRRSRASRPSPPARPGEAGAARPAAEGRRPLGLAPLALAAQGPASGRSRCRPLSTAAIGGNDRRRLVRPSADDPLGDEAEAPEEESQDRHGERAGVEVRSPDAEGDQECPGQHHQVSGFQSFGIHRPAPGGTNRGR